MYALLKAHWYWPNMLADCVIACKDATPCQIENAKFKAPTYVLPSQKDFYPFHTWCIDLITSLRQADEGEGGAKGRVLVVCVCAFSKWIEAAILPDKRSFTVA